MSRKLPPIHESRDALKDLLKKTRKPALKRRIHMLVLFKKGTCTMRAAAAEHLAVHRHTISQWLNSYAASGLDGLLEMKKTGSKEVQRSLEPAVFESLKARLRDEEGFKGYKEIQAWLSDTHDVRLPYRTVHGMVRDRLGAKPKKPRPVHPKKKLSKPQNSSNNSTGGSQL